MKGSTHTYVTLNEIVNKALADITEGSHRKEQFLLWALDYYRKLKLDVARDVRTVSLQMTPYKSIILPDDCVDWISIGIKNGEVLDTFVNKWRDLIPRASANDDEEPTAPTYTLSDPDGEGIVFCNYTDTGGNPGKLFGLLVKDNLHGYFTPNMNQHVNEIQLSASVPAGTPIFLMYLSTVFDPTIESIISPYFEDYIRKGIHYENLKHSRNSGNRRITSEMVFEAKQERDDELCLAVERRWDLSVDDIIEICRQGYSLAPKIP